MFEDIIFPLRKLLFHDDVKLLAIASEHSYADSYVGVKKGTSRFFNKVKSRCSYSKFLVDATKNVVIEEMQKVCNSDLAVIFYSGHGGHQKSKSEPDGYDEYIVLYDKPLFDNEIWPIVSKAQGRVLTIFDCCYAGTMFRNSCQSYPVPFSFKNSDDSVDLMCWSACAENTVSYGTNVSGGFFTSALVKAIKATSTYEDVWKTITKNSTLSARQTAQRTILRTNTKFKHKKFLS